MRGVPTVIYRCGARIEIIGRRGLWTPTVYRGDRDYASSLPSETTKKKAIARARAMLCRR